MIPSCASVSVLSHLFLCLLELSLLLLDPDDELLAHVLLLLLQRAQVRRPSSVVLLGERGGLAVDLLAVGEAHLLQTVLPERNGENDEIILWSVVCLIIKGGIF